MDESSGSCIRCGKRDHLLEVECVPYTLQMDRVLRVGSTEMRRRGAIFKHETVCVCPDCARRAVRNKAVTVAIAQFVVWFAGLLIVAGVFRAFVRSSTLNVPEALFGVIPMVLAVAVAACVGAIAGRLRFKQYAALPDAFGAAFLRFKKKGNTNLYLPCERSLYPGTDAAAQKESFSRFSMISGTDGRILMDEIWEKHTR